MSEGRIGTARTGQRARRTTCSVVLPRSTSRNPCLPCVVRILCDRAQSYCERHHKYPAASSTCKTEPSIESGDTRTLY